MNDIIVVARDTKTFTLWAIEQQADLLYDVPGQVRVLIGKKTYVLVKPDNADALRGKWKTSHVIYLDDSASEEFKQRISKRKK